MFRMAKLGILLLLVSACGAATPSAGTPDESGGDGSTAGGGADVPVSPLKEGPPPPSDAENSEYSATCNPIEPDHYDAGKVGMSTLQNELVAGTASEAAEKKALAAALKAMEGKTGGLGGSDVTRCNALFGIKMKRRLFDHEPWEADARGSVDSCVKRVVAAFGKESMVVDMGGAADVASHGPFCPDDFPVPESLTDLPYKSEGADWDTPTWKCLEFGLRSEQNYQIEYSAPRGENMFACIARFLPRQGGTPIEIIRGGKVNEEGELLVSEKIKKRRMK